MTLFMDRGEVLLMCAAEGGVANAYGTLSVTPSLPANVFKTRCHCAPGPTGMRTSRDSPVSASCLVQRMLGLQMSASASKFTWALETGIRFLTNA